MSLGKRPYFAFCLGLTLAPAAALANDGGAPTRDGGSSPAKPASPAAPATTTKPPVAPVAGSTTKPSAPGASAPAVAASGNPDGGAPHATDTAKKPESLDDLLEAASPGSRLAAPTPTKAEEKKPTPVARPSVPKPAPKPAPVAQKPLEPSGPPTDDNDTTAEASAPTKLVAVKPTGQPRVRGPYELGPLDCRVLDGAGIERVLPKRIVSGEEPDLLCRLVVTQPANVAALQHSVALSVLVGDKETYRQTRNVRVGTAGRRAMIFIVPSDKISSDDPVQVTVQATLSPPALPAGGRAAKFIVESED